MMEKVILSFVFGLLLGAIAIWLRMRNLQKENDILTRNIEERRAALRQNSMSMDELKKDLEATREENKKQNAELAGLKTSNKYLEKSLTHQQVDLEKSQQRMRADFENLSNKILDKNSKKITDQSKIDLDQILKPFKEKIKNFESSVENKHIQDAKDRARLIEKITHLSDLNQIIHKETKNLTSALKGDTKKQGNWGELVLERVLEQSGLMKGSEYYTQVHAESDAGKRYRPDVVVNLPDNKHLIIDSKVSLTAYESAVSSEDSEERSGHIKRHLISVKNHIKELSAKNYQNAVGMDSPDFVLMFMPIEASFSLAVKEDIDIYSFAWEKKVVIVSPSTLLATLKTITSLWKQEKQNLNAIEIATQAGALYDKFVGFSDDLVKVGQQLNTTTKVYQASMNKLTEGNGNLVRRVEKIKELGAKTTKKISDQLRDRSNNHIEKTEKE